MNIQLGRSFNRYSMVCNGRTNLAVAGIHGGQMKTQGAVTHLLNQWQSGNQGAGEKVIGDIYIDLEQMARQLLGKGDYRFTLEAGDLIHETLTRLMGERITWNDRQHFFALMAKTMRRVLVDQARMRNRQKRGGEVSKITFNEERHGDSPLSCDLLDLEMALVDLGSLDPRQCKVVELRLFLGLTIQEIAEVLSLSTRTIHTEWRMAKAWLLGKLEGDV